jgi:hypothetical protein
MTELPARTPGAVTADGPCSTGTFVPFIQNGPVLTPDYPTSTSSVASAGAGTGTGESVPRSSSAA